MALSKIEERKIILQRYFHFEWKWDKARALIAKMGWESDLSLDDAAQRLTDQAFLDAFNELIPDIYRSFRGRFYTVGDNGLVLKSSADEIREAVQKLIDEKGAKAYSLLRALCELGEAPFERIASKASEILGQRSYPSRLISEACNVYDLVWDVGSRKYPSWAMPEEIKPFVLDELAKYETKGINVLSTSLAQGELDELKKLDNEFETYLNDLVQHRLDKTIEFGRNISVTILSQSLEDMFGPVLSFDNLLSLIQQYSLADVEIINRNGRIAGYTGFNLAFFGAPGTGKTFAVDDMIRGNERMGIPPHGLPGRNRYCGGMTAAKFIRIGEAYEGRRFNFIVPEFNDWFKYKGMVEPLKLAMEQREIKYEIKNETVGPYKFNSFFSVNYNTKVSGKGYQLTVSDPNFVAIEDRMLCILQRMTKQRFTALRDSQRKLRLGKFNFELANDLRDHLALVYATGTRHPLVKQKFQYKPIIISEKLDDKLKLVDDLLLEEIKHEEMLGVSARLAERAVKLACASSLLNYFSSGETIEPLDDAIYLALKFYIEEMNVRSQERFDVKCILGKIT
jgi:hypothetical protein